eukprot:2366-Heterococcus_DN1.PRE.1
MQQNSCLNTNDAVCHCIAAVYVAQHHISAAVYTHMEVTAVRVYSNVATAGASAVQRQSTPGVLRRMNLRVQ